MAQPVRKIGVIILALLAFAIVPLLSAQAKPQSVNAARLANHPKILVLYDMEGVSNVADPQHVLASHRAEYALGRKWLTSDVNAAIRGLAAGGAGPIWIQDAHGSGNSKEPDILIDEMDRRASFDFRSYNFDPYSTGIDGSVDAIVCIGMHARANTSGFMAHTYTIDLDFRVNDVEFTETHIVAASAARWGIPVIMVSGDNILAEQLPHDFPELQFATVKTAKSHSVAEPLAAGEAEKRIESAASKAMQKFIDGKFRPYYLNPPYDFKISFPDYQEVEGAAQNPLVQRDGDAAIRFRTASFIEGYEIARTSIYLAVERYTSAAMLRMLANDPAGKKFLDQFEDVVIQRWLDWDHAPEWSKPGPPAPAKQIFYGDN